MREPLVELETIEIKSPCHVPWDSMTGDDRSRHCKSCKLNVYNIESLTRDEALKLINGKEGGVCLRLHRRADGKVLTKDCAPIRASRARRIAAVTIVCSVFLAVQGAAFVMNAQSRSNGALGNGIGPLDTVGEFCKDGGRLMISQQNIEDIRKTPLYKCKPVKSAVDWAEDTLYPRPVMMGLYL